MCYSTQSRSKVESQYMKWSRRYRLISVQVLFTQFVGRCLRRLHKDDPVEAMLISHPYYDQRQNYDNLEEIAEVDPEEEEEEIWFYL